MAVRPQRAQDDKATSQDQIPTHQYESASAREHKRFLTVNRQRQALLPKAILTGLLAGAAAVAFHLCLDLGEDLRNEWLAKAHHWGRPGLVAVAGVAAALAMLAACLVRVFAPEAGGSGIPHVKAVLQGNRAFRWLRVLLVKFVSGLIGISAGLALGREGPTVQMGAAVGNGVSTLPPIRQHERLVLLAAGGGAGLSAAFNSPLAGVVFVLEELQGRFASLEFFAAALACLTADMVCRVMLGQFPVFKVSLVNAPDLVLLLAFIPLGALLGFFGVVFNRALLAAQKLGSLPVRWQWAWWMACGTLVGVAGWVEPDWLGGGQHFLDGLFNTGLPISAIPLFIGMRFVLTIASYSTGAAGGIFSPILVLGALLGFFFEHVVHLLFPQLAIEANAFAVVGMAAYFTGVVRAPLTGIVLMIEMTGNYALILPLFAACFSALLIADGLNDLPIYEALLERDLQKSKNGNR